nr:hypothetical protein [Muricauda sp. CP2A]
MGTLVPIPVKSLPGVASPPTVKFTVIGEPVLFTASRVTVNSPLVKGLSLAVGPLAVIVAVKTSSLFIVTVAVSVISTTAPFRLSMKMVKVSSNSTVVSVVGRTSNVCVSPGVPEKLRVKLVSGV